MNETMENMGDVLHSVQRTGHEVCEGATATSLVREIRCLKREGGHLGRVGGSLFRRRVSKDERKAGAAVPLDLLFASLLCEVFRKM